jgi:hypothetical protein
MHVTFYCYMIHKYKYEHRLQKSCMPVRLRSEGIYGWGPMIEKEPHLHILSSIP